MKKMLSVLSAAVLVLSAFPFAASAEANSTADSANTAEIGDTLYTFIYTDEADKKIEITGASGTGEELVIPSEIDGCSVISIGEKAFFGNLDLISVEIPETVTSIGDKTFTGCLALETITLPDSVKSLGESCFLSCTSLKNVTLGKNLTAIPENCFYSCTALNSINIPENISGIGAQAFFGCSQLSGIYLPPTVEEIGSDAVGRHYDIRSGSTQNISGFFIKGIFGSQADSYAGNYGITFKTAKAVLGDVNEDGMLDARDASTVLQEYANVSSGCESSFSEAQKKLANYNKDGYVDAKDASLILQEYARIQSEA